MLEVAKKYVLSMLLENEEVQKFPKDFTTAAMQWIRSWFLKDDPSAEVVINLPGNEEVKAKIIEAKLPKLLEDPRFVEELKARLGAFEHQKIRVKNVVDETSEIKAGGSVTIGDKGSISHDEGYDQKNIVKGKIEAGKDVHIGDAYHRAGDFFNVVNQYFLQPDSGLHKPVAALSGLKKELTELVSRGEIGEAIHFLKDLSGQTADFQSTVVQLSGRWAQLNRQKKHGTVSVADANLEWARISLAVQEMINELSENPVF